MALTGSTIASTYLKLLRINTDTMGADATASYIQDSADTDSALSISTTRVGIGTASPDGTLHVHTATAGSVTAVAAEDDLVVENSGSGGISILVPDASAGSLVFGSPSDADGGIVRWEHDQDLMTIGPDNTGAELRFMTGPFTEQVRIDSSGNVGIGDSSPDAHLEVRNDAVDTNLHYMGIRSSHTKTAGGSATNDDYYGIRSDFTFNDPDAYHGTLNGASIIAHNSNSLDSPRMQGLMVEAKLSGASDVENMYGEYITTNVDAGTVDANVYGQYTNVDIDGGTLSGTVYGEYINIASTVNPSSDIKGLTIVMSGAGLDATGDYFLFLYDAENSDTVAQITALEGVATFDDGDFAGAPDYAEYFESKDGNAIAVGTTVKLDGDKVVACSEGDTPIGVVRPDGVGTSAYKAGCQNLRWQGKYLYDNYNELQHEDYTIKEWTEEITFDEYVARGKDETGGSLGGNVKDEKVEGSKAIPAKDAVTRQKTVDEEVEEEVTTTELVDGKYVQKTETVTKTVKVPQYNEVDLYDNDGNVIGKHQVPIMETVEEAVAGVDAVVETYFRKHNYHSDRIPEGLTVPDDAETITPGHQRKKLNPDYDASKHDSYKARPDRDEWNLIGLLGQIPITKGQPMSDNWIKMKDVSDTVEMYFVK